MNNCKKCSTVLVLLSIVFLPSYLYAQDVLYFFSAPGAGAATGLTSDGDNIFSAAVMESSSVVYESDTLGNILSSFTWEDGILTGLAWDGQYLWLSQALSEVLHQVARDGNMVGHLATSLSSPAGLTWDGNYLWAIDLYNQTVNQIDLNGQVIKSFTVPTFGDVITGLGWDGTFLWVCGAFLNKIYQVSPSGAVLKVFDGPGLSATDLEWDPNYLWVSDVVTDRIYKLKVSPVDQIVQARVEFPGGHWPMAWKFADRKPSCDTTLEIDDEDLAYWNDLTSKEYQEKLACRRKINCFIGDLKLDSLTFDVGDILIETIRANAIVPVMTKKNCNDMSAIAGLGTAAPQACFDVRYFRHLDRFEGKVLRVRFDATQIFKTIDWAGAGDTVEICVSGYLKNGMKFEGCTDIVIVGDNPTDVAPGNEILPKRFSLLGNYPNPFNASTVVKFQLSRPGLVELTVYNILGQKIRTLVKEQMTAGPKQVSWDGTDDLGHLLASGIYFYKIITVEGRQTGKMTMLK